MNYFTPDNWNHVQYINENQRALVSIGADLKGDLLYFVTVIDENDQVLYQSEHKTVEKACFHINDKYQEFWDFSNLATAGTGGGCGSCNAH